MENELPLFAYAAPLAAVLGVILLVWCVKKLGRIIFPKTRILFSSSEEKTVTLPAPGRYVISVVFPMRAVFIGVSHYSASFSIEHLTRSQAVAYHHYSRLNLFRVQRSDMRGNKSMPLGDFECEEVGDYRIVCTTPESIRSDFSMEVSNYTSPLSLMGFIPLTILAFGMTVGGIIVSLAIFTGRI